MSSGQPGPSWRTPGRRTTLLPGGRLPCMTADATEDQRWDGHTDSHQAHDAIHALEHAHEQELSRHEEKRLSEALEAHDRDHDATKLAVATALASVDKLALIHTVAHEREHVAHELRHKDATEAIAKAEVAMDKRLIGLNEAREQAREQARDFASSERVDIMVTALDRRFGEAAKHNDERYEENRRRIEAIEKGDSKQEGRSLGQGATIAIIVATVAFVGTILGIIITIANLATGAS